jgi:hypothetical protein
LKAAVTALLLLATIGIMVQVSGQCLSPEESPFYSYESEIIENPTEWTGERSVNGSIIVDDHLTIMDSEVTLSGEGIIVRENATLEIKNSRISPLNPGSGFYMESYGRLVLEDVSILDCLDRSNMYFGLYSMGGNLSVVNTTMVRSGMLQSGIDSVIIENSSLSGIIALSGNVTIKDSKMNGMGTSLLGSGDLTVTDSSFTSNTSFSNSIAAISCEGGSLRMNGVRVNGSYGGAVYADDSEVDISDLEADLPLAQYGIRLLESSPRILDSLEITGPRTALEIYQCPGIISISNTTLQSTFRGVSISGPGIANISDLSVRNASYGILTSTITTITNTVLDDTQIGLILEGDWAVEAKDFAISNFSRWGVQAQTWDEVIIPGISFQPGNDAISNTSYWGPIEVIIKGPYGEVVEGADIEIDSVLGRRSGIDSGTVGVVWGYSIPGSEPVRIEYTIRGSWGNANTSKIVKISEAMTVELVLPMTDISILDLKRNREDVIVTLVSNGTRANDVKITLYVDGTYRFSQKVSLDRGVETEVEMPVGNMEEGEHEILVSVRSNDEYSGMNGILLENNHMVLSVSEEGESGDNRLQILAFALAFVAVILIIATLLLRRRD